ncbi:MAG: hypothetical protein L0Y58_23845 [Verrucomicrobia subdivision 3 bacterium]|nr:hypothetical protein [Limisphaerales bacterium]
MNHARPQARQIREREQAEGSPQSRLIRVRERSASASNPRQQARQQSVRIRDEERVSTARDATAATDVDTPRAGRDSELAVATTSPLTCSGRESELAANCPRHRLAVAISPTIRFPVHIRIISNHVRI